MLKKIGKEAEVILDGIMGGGGGLFGGGELRSVLALEDAMTSTQVEIQKVFLRPLMTTKKRIKLREIVQIKNKVFLDIKV